MSALEAPDWPNRPYKCFYSQALWCLCVKEFIRWVRPIRCQTARHFNVQPFGASGLKGVKQLSCQQLVSLINFLMVGLTQMPMCPLSYSLLAAELSLSLFHNCATRRDVICHLPEVALNPNQPTNKPTSQQLCSSVAEDQLCRRIYISSSLFVYPEALIHF